MVALAKTWYIDINHVPNNQTTAALAYSNALFDLKVFLTGGAAYSTGAAPAGASQDGAWTVVRSSDGGGVNAGAADYWTAPSKVVQDDAGNNHSWIVLQSPTNYVPGGQIQILIDCKGTDNEVATFIWSNSANPFTGGTITAAPSAPAEAWSRGSLQILENSLLGPHKQHFWRNSSGDFWTLASKNGSGIVAHMFATAKGYDGEVSSPADPWPVWGGANYSVAGARGTMTIATIQSTAAFSAGWWVDNTREQNVISYPGLTSGSGGVLASVNYPSSGSALTSRLPAFPMDIYPILTVGRGCYRGRLADMRWSFPLSPFNTAEGGTDTYRRITVGDLCMFTAGGAILSL